MAVARRTQVVAGPVLADSVRLILGDITKFQGDAIVNAANSRLMHGGGVARAISVAAGPGLDEEGQEELKSHGPIEVGDALATKGYELPATWVIHVVGPIYGNHGGAEAELLARAYESSLDLAREYQVKTIAFPAISAGIYGYPLDEAARIAVETVREHGEGLDVTLVLFDEETMRVFERALNS